MENPIITAVQMNSQQNIDENFSIASRAVVDAKQQGASLVVLPENVCSMGKQKQTAERFDELSLHFSQLAQQQNLYLLAGTLPCPYRPDSSLVKNNKVRQVSQLFAPDGTLVARYDKIHLFKATVDDATANYDESQTFEAGTQLVVAPIRLLNHTYHLGMMICFDLRFPSMAQRLRQMGADILTAPAAFTYATGKAHWSMLLQARALDSQCMLIGAAQGGTHHENERSDNSDDTLLDTSLRSIQSRQSLTSPTSRQTWGHATITGADGSIKTSHPDSQVPAEQGYQLISSHFDNKHQQKQRQKLPIFDCHRLA